jgi:hypothetical protein
MNISCKEVEIEITTKCNTNCYDCNHLCSDYQAPDILEISIDQLINFFEQSIGCDISWEKVCIIGGEPLLHSNFVNMIDIFAFYKDKIKIPTMSISTNIRSKEVDSLLREISRKHQFFNCYGLSPKNRFQCDFVPINLAPIDIGIKDKIDCEWKYGFCFSAYGLYNCSPAAAIDRVLGKNLGIKNLNLISKESLYNSFFYVG